MKLRIRIRGSAREWVIPTTSRVPVSVILTVVSLLRVTLPDMVILPGGITMMVVLI